MGSKSGPNKGEREFETMSDEFFKAGSENMYNNMKRTYDEYQGVQLDQTRALNNIAIQALQNAVSVAQKVANNSAETDNMVAKQAVRHSDIAIDRQWNVDEQSWSVAQIIKAMEGVIEKAKVA